jgi:hypothetical protein
MSNEPPLPDFNQFTRWLAQQPRAPIHRPERYEELLTAAHAARDEFLAARQGAAPQALGAAPQAAGHGPIEVLQLLAAADRSDSSRPPEVTTARGFRVTLAYEEGAELEASSICVLVRCPPELIETIQGQTAYLWNGKERFELGEFDAEGKAIGTLPAGIQISVSDFARGNVRLEEPPPTTENREP